MQYCGTKSHGGISAQKNSTAHDKHVARKKTKRTGKEPQLPMSVRTPTGWDPTTSPNYGTPIPGHLVTGRGRVIPYQRRANVCRCLYGRKSRLNMSLRGVDAAPTFIEVPSPTNMRLRARQVLNQAVLTLAMAMAVNACSSVPHGQTRPDQPEGRSQYLIMASELESTNRPNLYDAVHQLRPGWFTRPTRGRQGEDAIVVYLEDRQMGSVDILKNVSTQTVQAVRYLGPTEAQVRFGQINGGRPAIILETKRQ